MIDGREVGSTYIWTISQIFYKVENETCEDSLLPIGSDSYLLTYYVSLLTLKDLRRAILNLKHLKILLEGDGA